MGFLKQRIAIDLGTTYSVVAHESADHFWRLPSTIAFRPDSEEPVAFGEQAKAMTGRGNSQNRVVQPLKDGVISDFDAAGRYLEFLVSHSKKGLVSVGYEIFICVPWGASPVELEAYRQRVTQPRTTLRLIREPFAAAVGSGLDVFGEKGHTIVDIGGGTTEIATLAHGHMLACRSLRCAGNSLDVALVEGLRDLREFEIGYLTAESLKIHYGTVAPLADEFQVDVKGVDRITRLPRIACLRTDEIRVCLEPVISKIEEHILRHIEELPGDMTKNLSQEGVWMVGGGASLKGWKERLEPRLGIPIRIPEQPHLAVIRGMKAIISDLERFQSLIDISESTLI